MRGTLVFDGECGFCTRTLRWLRRIDRRGRVTPRPSQASGVLAPMGLTARDAANSVWWFGDDGRLAHGAEAVNQAVAAAIGTRAPLALYRLTRWPQERLYRWVAAHRHRFPGVTPYCTEHPHECR